MTPAPPTGTRNRTPAELELDPAPRWTRPPKDLPERRAQSGFERSLEHLRAMALRVWAARLWWTLSAAYIAVGVFLVVHSDLMVLDALSRSAHAFMVWHNGPPKLAGLGFVWPPVTTLSLLPFALFEGFGRSGLAAPVCSALVMATAVWLLAREVRGMNLGRGWSAVVVAAVAVNPVIVFYAANGMSEAWAVLLPLALLAAMIRWNTSGSVVALAGASFAAAACVMARYELGALVVLLLASVAVGTYRLERNHGMARAYVLFTAVPTIYALGIWGLFNWTVQGSPVWFLTHGGQIATAAGTAATVGHPSALDTLNRGSGLLSLLYVQLMFVPALGIVVAGLVVWAGVRRRWFALAVAGVVASGLLTNAALVAANGNMWMTNLRFNMRALPLVALAGCWLAVQVGREYGRRWQTAALATLAVALVAGLPTTWHVMRTYDVTFGEDAFIAAVSTRKPLSGTKWSSDLTVGCDGARAMGSWIRSNVRERDSILADDVSTYAVMLFSGHPERFVDRVDKGDAYFYDQVHRPGAKVHYLLASSFTYCSGVTSDAIAERLGPLKGATPKAGLRRIKSTRGFTLYRVEGSPQW